MTSRNATIRARVLSDIRRALRRDGPLDAQQSSALRDRMARANAAARRAANVSGDPSAGDKRSDTIADFVARLHESGAQVSQISALHDVPDAIAAICHAWRLPTDFVATSHNLLNDIQWPASFKLHYRVAGRDDQIALTGAECAIVETGSVVMRSGAPSPSSVNFLPENHIVVIREAQLLARLEDAWGALYDDTGRIPRAVNLVTGPSKTADVEQTLQHGAHGPRCLHVVLVMDSSA